MNFRTDLALEENENLQTKPEGVESYEQDIEDCKITHIRITSESAAEQLRKPQGSYITLEVPAISDHIDGQDKYTRLAAQELEKLLPKSGFVLVVGLGNRDITPDALGPKTLELLFATRHIQGELARVTGMEGLRPVAGISAGVLGNTGIDAFELLQALVQKLKPDAVIAIDALASRNLARLGCTVQMSDAGIAPGAGVGNARPQISLQTLGVPVISMGVPTVVDVATLAADLLTEDENQMEMLKEELAPRGAQMVVTPREIDLLISRAAKLLAMAINLTLNPQFTVEEFLSLV